MPYIQSGKETGKPVNIYYEDWGKGKPVVLIHGWPVSHEMWEYQLTELPQHDIRCIAYDRRGFGKSDKPWGDYDYTTLANDLRALLEQLDLQDVTLAGFSMGGGEVARYCSLYNCERVSKVILISSVTPYMLKTDFNPDGVEKEVFDQMLAQLQEDRPAFLSAFGKQFFGVDWMSHPVSEGILQWMHDLAMSSSPKAIIGCLHAFSETDFHDDMPAIKVPALVIHGDSDKTVPIETAGNHTAAMINHCVFKIYQGAPHGLFITEKQQLNDDIISFITNGSVPYFVSESAKEISVF
jgi:non-heme chloroperoxidase